jgi:ATP-dependent DNA helicase RecG
VTQIIERTLEYLNRMVVMQSIIKPKNDNHSIKFYTYPYQALEESITNSLYHRDYREWEPVVITVEPKGITIQNVGGPDRSIPTADISRGELLISKRYRNRRLGEYLKELELTEGRSTGIPTIQNVLKANGSPRAIVVTDEERTFFRITIPCHEAAGNIIADIASKDKQNPIDGTKDAPKELTDRQKVIIEMIVADPFLSAKAISEKMSEKMSEKEGTNERTIERDIAKLKKLGILTREGGRKEGKWVIKTNDNN